MRNTTDIRNSTDIHPGYRVACWEVVELVDPSATAQGRGAGRGPWGGRWRMRCVECGGEKIAVAAAIRACDPDFRCPVVAGDTGIGRELHTTVSK